MVTSDETNSSNPAIYYYNGTKYSIVGGSGGGGTGGSTASDITVSTTNFNKNLSSNETTVQKTLDKLDDLAINGLPYELGNYSIAYVYNADEKIEKETITGSISRVTNFEYYTTGADLGKISKQTIVENGKTVISNYSYANAKISGVVVATT